MFGYLVAAPELMTEPQLGRYRAAYCGLCRSLRARHGQISGLTLTYDMTFLVLFLSSLYEPEETTIGCGFEVLIRSFARRLSAGRSIYIQIPPFLF